MKLKAISLHQPWASAMAFGVKKIETRGWQTWHTGLIAIHAAGVQTVAQLDFFEERIIDGHPNIAGAFLSHNAQYFDRLPFGYVVAIADLLECVRTDMISPLSPAEQALGDYSKGRFGWIFKNIWRMKTPFEVRGRQRIFNVDIPNAFLPEEVLRKEKQ